MDSNNSLPISTELQTFTTTLNKSLSTLLKKLKSQIKETQFITDSNFIPYLTYFELINEYKDWKSFIEEKNLLMLEKLRGECQKIVSSEISDSKEKCLGQQFRRMRRYFSN